MTARPGPRRLRTVLVAAALAAATALVAGCGATGTAAGDPAAASAASSAAPAGTPAVALPGVGRPAPDGAYTTTGGHTASIHALRGHPTLVWFVTTWCPSCQAGTKTMAGHIAALAADGVNVVELKLYKNLGGPNTPMRGFVHAYAGAAAGNSHWSFGTASAALTRTYDPGAYLDIYYLINAQGQITYINGSPGSTMPQLLSAAKALA